MSRICGDLATRPPASTAPVSTDDDLALLKEAGFTRYGTILKYLAFE
ncbi:hypothetical protein ABGB14_37245 [Nonomuraea sp. B10E15]